MQNHKRNLNHWTGILTHQNTQVSIYVCTTLSLPVSPFIRYANVEKIFRCSFVLFLLNWAYIWVIYEKLLSMMIYMSINRRVSLIGDFLTCYTIICITIGYRYRQYLIAYIMLCIMTKTNNEINIDKQKPTVNLCINLW